MIQTYQTNNAWISGFAAGLQRAATDLTDLWQAAERGLQRIRRNATLLWSFLAHTGLTIPGT